MLGHSQAKFVDAGCRRGSLKQAAMRMLWSFRQASGSRALRIIFAGSSPTERATSAK